MPRNIKSPETHLKPSEDTYFSLSNLGVPSEAITDVIDDLNLTSSLLNPQDTYPPLKEEICSIFPSRIVTSIEPIVSMLDVPKLDTSNNASSHKSYLLSLTCDSSNAATSKNHQGHSKHNPTTAVPVPTVVQNKKEFSGDHRFPPGRPPLRVTPRPDQTAAINAAFAAWPQEPLPPSAPGSFEAALEGIRKLMMPAAVADGSEQKLERFFGTGPPPTVCTPASLRDPEFEVSACEDYNAASNRQMGTVRYLTNREANRLWGLNDLPAGQASTEHKSRSSVTPRVNTGVVTDMRDNAGINSSSALPDLAEAPQVALIVPSQLVPQATLMCSRIKTPQQGSETLRDTPLLVKYLDLTLDDRATPGEGLRDQWVQTLTLHLIMIAQVGPLQMRMLASASISVPGDRWKQPLLYDSPVGKARHGGRAEIKSVSSGHKKGEVLTGGTVEQNSTKMQGGRAYPEPKLGAESGDAQVTAAKRTGAHLTVTPALSLRQRILALKPPIPARAGHPSQTGVSAGGPTSFAGGRSLRKTRRGQDQEQQHPPLSAAVAGGGRDYTRGAQKDSSNEEHRAKERAPEEETGPGPKELPIDEVPAVTESTSTDCGSTVPVTQAVTEREATCSASPMPSRGSRRAKGLLHQKEERRAECATHDRPRLMQGSGRQTLSQRREFQARHPRYPATQSESLLVSIIRNKRGRRIAKVDPESSEQCHPYHTTPQSIRDVAGSAEELARLGPKGTVSDRLPTQAGRRYQSRWMPMAPERLELEGNAPTVSPLVDHTGRSHRRRRRRRRSHRSSRNAVISDTSTERSVSDPVQPGWKRSANGGVSRIEGEESLDGIMITHLTGNGAKGETANQNCGLPMVASLEAPALEVAGAVGEETLGTAPVHVSEEVLPGDKLEGRSQPDPSIEPIATWSAGDEPTGIMEPALVPESVEVLLVKDEVKWKIEVLRADWSEMEAIGLGSHFGFALRLAFHRFRCTGPHHGKQKQQMANMLFVPHDAMHLVTSRPSTWDEMVGHSEKGGFFRVAGILRGGMNQEVERLLDSTVFNESLPWDQIDQDLACVRSGAPVLAEQLTHSMRLAQALAGCVALQQWDSLATFLSALSQEERAGMVLTPARLAALSVVASRRQPAAASTPSWLLSTTYSELRFNHLIPEDFVPNPQLARELVGQLQDAIINRILNVAPGIKTHANFQLQDLREDLKIEINPKNPGLFSATLVMPTGQWIDDFYTGAISLGRLSFCTIIPTDLHIEAEVSNADQQIIRAVHRAIGVDITTFRRMFDVSLGTAIQSNTVRSRETTLRYIPGNGNKGGRVTKEHVSPESQESSLLVSMDGTSLLVARRSLTRLPLRLGIGDEFPVTIGFTLPQCPHHAQQSMLLPRAPSIIRPRVPGAKVETPVLLIDPLPKGSLPEQTVNSGARMAEARHNMRAACQHALQTRDARLVGRYDRSRSPMFMYLEFSSADAAQNFATVSDQQVPPALTQLLRALFGDKALPHLQLWHCSVIAEILNGADEKTLKQLMAHGQQATHGTGAAASGPDNPAVAQH